MIESVILTALGADDLSHGSTFPLVPGGAAAPAPVPFWSQPSTDEPEVTEGECVRAGAQASNPIPAASIGFDVGGGSAEALLSQGSTTGGEEVRDHGSEVWKRPNQICIRFPPSKILRNYLSSFWQYIFHWGISTTYRRMRPFRNVQCLDLHFEINFQLWIRLIIDGTILPVVSIPRPLASPKDQCLSMVRADVKDWKYWRPRMKCPADRPGRYLPASRHHVCNQTVDC